MRYLINPVKALLSLFAFILFLFLFVVSFQSHKIIPMVLYAVLSVVYFLLLCHFTKYLEIDENGVRNRFLWKSYNELSWDKIQEVGIANMKVMKNAERTKVGELYLYFSPESMTEKERFHMCLNWPPKEKRYMRYSVKRLKAVQKYWEEKPVFAWLKEEAYLDRYDIVMNSHHDYRAVGGPIAPTVMPNAIQCCKDLVAGTPHLMQIDNPLKLEGADPTITVASLDGISWVVFNPEGIHRV